MMMTKGVSNKKIEEKNEKQKNYVSQVINLPFVELQSSETCIKKKIHVEPAFEYFISLNVML